MSVGSSALFPPNRGSKFPISITVKQLEKAGSQTRQVTTPNLASSKLLKPKVKEDSFEEMASGLITVALSSY